ncbi:chemotaxis-specific protein-glutamate methyltransferase CheB [bacterium]|nr:chemotaxis-specific protein-glutamate methyltransferase CheB [bacterium]
MNKQKIRVLVVDDSALIRKILSDLLGQHPSIEVVGTAQDGSFVLSKIEQLKPDVITLDVEMRKTGGLEILPQIVQKYNLPVIMVSAVTERGAEATFKALELGAIDFVTKPHAGSPSGVQEIANMLAAKIVAVSRNKPDVKRQPSTGPLARPSFRKAVDTAKPIPPRVATPSLNLNAIAIGASTGGTEAIKEVLLNLPTNLPGIVIVQHMPAGFTKAFANRLDGLCKIHVKEAEDGDIVSPGTALIAPGDHHMEVNGTANNLRVRLQQSPPVNRHRPSVDVLFHSVAKKIGKKCLGVILTGMGGDGSQGLKAIRDQGAVTVAQDEESCVVFGMPKEAIKLNGASYVLPLSQIGGFLVEAVNK